MVSNFGWWPSKTNMKFSMKIATIKGPNTALQDNKYSFFFQIMTLQMESHVSVDVLLSWYLLLLAGASVQTCEDWQEPSGHAYLLQNPQHQQR